MQKNLASGTSRLHSKCLVKTLSSLLIHSLGVTRYLTSTGLERGASLKRFRASHAFREQANVFDTHSASMHDVVDAGVICNGKLTDTLNSLRHQRFCEKVASKSSMLNHRPYQQHQEQQRTTACVYTCKSRNGRDLQMNFHPTDWGWQEYDEGFVPI